MSVSESERPGYRADEAASRSGHEGECRIRRVLFALNGYPRHARVFVPPTVAGSLLLDSIRVLTVVEHEEGMKKPSLDYGLVIVRYRELARLFTVQGAG